MAIYLNNKSVISSIVLIVFSVNLANASNLKNADKQLEFDRNYTMVLFDPRPYPDQYEYTEEELISLVKLVSTKFSKLLFDPILGISTDGRNNITNVTLAVAKFNKEHRESSSSPTAHLWIQVPFLETYGSFQNSTEYLENILNTVNKANQIFQGSVEGLIFNSKFLNYTNNKNETSITTEIPKIFQNTNYKIGIQYTNLTMTADMQNVIQSLSMMQTCCVMVFMDPKSADMAKGINATIRKFQQIMTALKSSIEYWNTGVKKITLILRTGYPSSNNNSKIKHRHSDLVQYWTSMSSLAVKKNITLAFTEAFDVPLRHSPASRSLGWWTLTKDEEEDEDVLKQKAEIINAELAQNIMAPTNLHKNVSYIFDDNNFNFRSYAGFLVELNPKCVVADLNEAKVIKLLQSVSEKFRAISIRDTDMNLEEIEKFMEILTKWNSQNSSKNITASITFSTQGSHDVMDTTASDLSFMKLQTIINQTNTRHPKTVSSAQFAINLAKLKEQISGLGLAKYRFVGDRSSLPYKFGIELPSSSCGRKFDGVVKPLLNFVNLVTLKYEIIQEATKHGVEKLVEKVRNKYVACRSKINAVNASIQVVLSTGWPDTDLHGNLDYESLVRFWFEMKSWARQNNTQVVMKEAFDSLKDSANLSKYGWWKTDKTTFSYETGYNFVEKRKIWIAENPEVTEEKTVNSTKAVNDTKSEKKPGYVNGNENKNISDNGTNYVSTNRSLSYPSISSNRSLNNIPVKRILAGDHQSGNVIDSVSSEDPWFLVKCSVPSACALVILMVLVSTIVYKMKKNVRTLTKDEAREFFEGSRKRGDDLGEEQYINGKYNEVNEVPLQSIGFDSVVGSGKFAIFYKACLANNVVAVKAPKKECTKLYYKSMLMEVKIMAGIGHHANVVKFLGSCTKDIRKGMVYIIMEYCQNGTLHSYLRSLRYNLETEDDEAAKTLQNIYDLYKFAYEIACGMQYLCEKDVIHGDLSAVNILLDGNNNCKVSNFGLSRKLDDTGDYIKRADGSWAWRWIALETIKHKIVTTRSDIWSYGVTLWEIFSLGRIPYKTYAQDGFLEKLEKGLRLKRPKYATQDVYDTMMQCWSKNPADRPQFQEDSEYFLLLMREEADQITTKS